MLIAMAWMINQSIFTILMIINCKSVISIMLPKDILFKHAAANSVLYGSDRELFDHQMGVLS